MDAAVRHGLQEQPDGGPGGEHVRGEREGGDEQAGPGLPHQPAPLPHYVQLGWFRFEISSSLYRKNNKVDCRVAFFVYK